MMDNELGAVLTMIHVNYPGGMPVFEGQYALELVEGIMYVAPVIEGLVIDGEADEMFRNISKATGLVVTYLKLCNFPSIDLTEKLADNIKGQLGPVKDLIQNAQIPTTLTVNRACAVLAMRTSISSDDFVQEVIDGLLAVDGLNNVVIICKDGTREYQKHNRHSGTSNTEVTQAETERSKVISDDDITNLKIALGSAKSFEDFIEQM